MISIMMKQRAHESFRKTSLFDSMMTSGCKLKNRCYTDDTNYVFSLYNAQYVLVEGRQLLPSNVCIVQYLRFFWFHQEKKRCHMCTFTHGVVFLLGFCCASWCSIQAVGRKRFPFFHINLIHKIADTVMVNELDRFSIKWFR